MLPFFAIAKIVTQVAQDVRSPLEKSKGYTGKAKGKRSALNLGNSEWACFPNPTFAFCYLPIAF
jgi:hypothetical protein